MMLSSCDDCGNGDGLGFHRGMGRRFRRVFSRGRGRGRGRSLRSMALRRLMRRRGRGRSLRSMALRRLMRRTARIRPALLPDRKSPGRKDFLRWLKVTDRGLFKRVMARVDANRRLRGARTISGIVTPAGPHTDELGGIWDDIKSAFSDTLKTGLALKQQRDLYKLQMARAEKGLPPLKTSELGPTIKTQIEIGPETRGQLFSEIGSGVKKFMIPLGIAGAAFYMMKKKK